MNLYREPTIAELDEYAEIGTWLPFIAPTDANRKIAVQIMLKVFDYQYKHSKEKAFENYEQSNEDRQKKGLAFKPIIDEEIELDRLNITIANSFEIAMQIMATVICESEIRRMENDDLEHVKNGSLNP